MISSLTSIDLVEEGSRLFDGGLIQKFGIVCEHQSSRPPAVLLVVLDVVLRIDALKRFKKKKKKKKDRGRIRIMFFTRRESEKEVLSEPWIMVE